MSTVWNSNVRVSVQPWWIDKSLYKPWHIHKPVDAWLTPISNPVLTLSPSHFSNISSDVVVLQGWAQGISLT
jgi:hypothetical protein